MDNQKYPQYQQLGQQLWLREEHATKLTHAKPDYEAVFRINQGPETVLGDLTSGGRLRLELHAGSGCGPHNSIHLTDGQGNQVTLYVREKRKEESHGAAA